MILFIHKIRTDGKNKVHISGFIDETAGTLSAKDGKNKAIVRYKLVDAGKDHKEDLKNIVIDGKWSLTPEHDLKLHISGSKEPLLENKTIIFSGVISDTGGNELKFRLRQYDNVFGNRTTGLSLRGRWKEDNNNRITFQVSRSNAKYDPLTFQGVWDINKNNELIYNYKRTVLKTRTKELQGLVFKGFWVLGKNKAIYRLEHSTDSLFSFKAAIISKQLTENENKIKLEIGVTYNSKGGRYTQKRSISIYGKWKLDKDLKCYFIVTYTGRRSRKMQFNIEKLFGDKDKMKISLSTVIGEKLGMELTFKKIFNNDSEMFAVISHMKDVKLLGGIKVKF